MNMVMFIRHKPQRSEPRKAPQTRSTAGVDAGTTQALFRPKGFTETVLFEVWEHLSQDINATLAAERQQHRQAALETDQEYQRALAAEPRRTFAKFAIRNCPQCGPQGVVVKPSMDCLVCKLREAIRRRAPTP